MSVFEKIFIRRYQVNSELKYSEIIYWGQVVTFEHLVGGYILYKKSFFLTLRKFLTFSVFHFDLKIVAIFVWISISCWLRRICVFFFFLYKRYRLI